MSQRHQLAFVTALVLDALEQQVPATAATEQQAEALRACASGIRAAMSAEAPRNLPSIYLPYLLAVGLGADTQAAVDAGVVCTAVYAAARLIDDLMDGHPPSYLPDTSTSENLLSLGTVQCASSYRLIATSASRCEARLRMTTALSACITSMAAGQLEDLAGMPKGATIPRILAAIRGKSGGALAGFAALGALAAGCDEAVETSCAAFGYHLGVARQIEADLAELASTGGGRPTRNRAITLPVALHIEAIDEAAGYAFHRRFNEATTPASFADLYAELTASGAIAATRVHVEMELTRAADSLERIPLDDRARLDLASLAGLSTSQRTHIQHDPNSRSLHAEISHP